MSQPGVYNIELEQGADYNVYLQFLDSERSPLDLTDWQLYAQAWNLAKTRKYADFSIAYTDPTQGTIRFGLSSILTADFPSQLIYDLLAVNSLGERSYLLEGTIYTNQSCTEVP